MTCKYCNGKLAPLRSLTDGEFCSDQHRYAFYQGQTRGAAEAIAAGAPPQPEPSPVPAVEPAASMAAAPQLEEPGSESRPQPEKPAPRRSRKFRFSPASGWLITGWKTASFELKALAVLMPLLVALILSPTLWKFKTRMVTARDNELSIRARQAVANRMNVLAQRISNRAAIAITDDFRSGLDSWESRSNLTKSWSFDANGFVQPGPLAILAPTEDMTDYSFEFLGEVQRRAMGAAFRARDLDNYYAVKFVYDDANAMPAFRLLRYAVINGKQGPAVEKRLPSTIRADMLNHFRVEVRGNDYTILAQGEVVDFFSDSRLKSGGVGFFCGRGETARLRWVEVSHQYDTLGKLCAYLAPFSLTGMGKD